MQKKIDELKLAIDVLFAQGYAYAAEILYLNCENWKHKRRDSS